MYNFLLAMPGATEWVIIAIVIGGLSFFWVKCIVEIAKSDFQPSSQKVVWLLVTILLGFVGALIYYFAGRSTRIAT